MIKIVDDLTPEDVAMLQALYSRSADSVDVHLDKVHASGSGKFMERYYVNYGHKSIADCGTTTIFIEGVSLLAAKAIQDWSLYCGQETSTRYIDMGKQRIVDPVGFDYSKRVLANWMEFYSSHQDRVAATVRERYPRRPEENEDAYNGAVKARTFDILRGFLPSGITTQLSWHTNLRQAGDHLLLLSKHPSREMRDIANEIGIALSKRYPSSGMGMSLASVSGVGNKDADAAAERARWEGIVATKHTHTSADGFPQEGFLSQIKGVHQYADLLASRPRGCVLPHFLSDLGQLSFAFELDFGSFRDLQRHRNGVCRMPLVTTDRGFEPWYLEQIDEKLQDEARKLIDQQTREIRDLSSDPVVRQYYTALGFRVPCQVTYALPAAVYVMEMRSAKTVHPTLRRVVQNVMVKNFQERFPSIALHVDTNPDDWTVRRGQQTIHAKS